MNTLSSILALGVFISACGPLQQLIPSRKKNQNQRDLSGQFTPPESGPLKLQSFAGCLEADSYLQNNFRRKLKESLDQQQYDWSHYDPNMRGMTKADTLVSTSAATSSNESLQAPGDYSKTNTQVAGVDEPDIMKTNGTHIFAISGQTIQIAESWPASSLKKLSSIPLNGAPIGLMLSEKQKLLVVYNPNQNISPGPWNNIPDRALLQTSAPWMSSSYPDHQITRLAFYDVSKPQSPTLERELTFYGSYVSMRRQGELLRLIQSENFLPFPKNVVSYVAIENFRGDITDFLRQRALVEAKNEQVLSTLTLKSYLQEIRADKPGISFDDPILSDLPDCQKLYAEEQMTNPGLSKITSLNLSRYELSQVTLLAPANQIYASETSLYLANSYSTWWWGWQFDQGSKTYIHKFKYDPQGSTLVSYQGSGVVNGNILNQFAMDEHQDHLRIAVTDDHVVERFTADRPGFTSSNRVYVLGIREGKLETIGRTPDLAVGERIYSTRFVGEKGYVVTFRQVDPLFTLDLSSPQSPKIIGELKIPGFSNYLHPISDTHLLAVGQDADPATGRVRGLKVSLFDVSDPTRPREAHSLVIGDTSWSWSEAQYDHKAFTYFASRGLLGIPVGGYRRSAQEDNWWDSYFSELMVFHVDPVMGITRKGSIAMNDIYKAKQTDWDSWWYGAQVQRSVFADDYIYAISDLGIRVVHQQDFANPIATLAFYP